MHCLLTHFDPISQVETAASERERLLLVKISELQTRMVNLTDELTAEKLKYMQLQQRLNAMSNRGEDGDRREVDS
nr:serine/threonine-protein kinase BLUS1-like isoform X1 [Ipomoea batatas]